MKMFIRGAWRTFSDTRWKQERCAATTSARKEPEAAASGINANEYNTGSDKEGPIGLPYHSSTKTQVSVAQTMPAEAPNIKVEPGATRGPSDANFEAKEAGNQQAPLDENSPRESGKSTD